jgi:hypothetical protein
MELSGTGGFDGW